MPDNDIPPLAWLADSPLFIDSRQISAFYDAVVGPAFRTVELQISAAQSQQTEKSTSLKLTAGLGSLFPWLHIDAEADVGRTSSRGSQESQNIVLQPVESATRDLVKLSLHYAVNQADRIWLISNGERFPSREVIAASPRMIAFIDAPDGTMFLPQAAELDNGRVVTFFDMLIEKLKRDGGTLPPAYPDDRAREESKSQRDAHWAWFAQHWNVDKVVKVVEEVIGDGGRPRWFDYRVTLPVGGTFHLHVDAHGEYDTGVFAYNLIRRGERHGTRIVGSLKANPALNALAIYEK
jgi:hypothetical protein